MCVRGCERIWCENVKDMVDVHCIALHVPFRTAIMAFRMGDNTRPPEFTVAYGKARMPVPTEILAKFTPAWNAVLMLFSSCFPRLLFLETSLVLTACSNSPQVAESAQENKQLSFRSERQQQCSWSYRRQRANVWSFHSNIRPRESYYSLDPSVLSPTNFQYKFRNN